MLPPKPIYQSAALVDAVKHELDLIANQNPNAVIIFAGDLNQLNVTGLLWNVARLWSAKILRMAPKFSTIFFYLCPTYLLLYIQLYCENKAHGIHPSATH